ncbi:hypothetical protein QBC35DRAFT_549091, partial [Podospora australis]
PRPSVWAKVAVCTGKNTSNPEDCVPVRVGPPETASTTITTATNQLERQLDRAFKHQRQLEQLARDEAVRRVAERTELRTQLAIVIRQRDDARRHAANLAQECEILRADLARVAGELENRIRERGLGAAVYPSVAAEPNIGRGNTIGVGGLPSQQPISAVKGMVRQFDLAALIQEDIPLVRDGLKRGMQGIDGQETKGKEVEEDKSDRE